MNLNLFSRLRRRRGKAPCLASAAAAGKSSIEKRLDRAAQPVEPARQQPVHAQGGQQRKRRTREQHVERVARRLAAQTEQAAGVRMACLRGRRDQSLSHDHLFHTLLGALDVATSLYGPTWELTHDYHLPALAPYGQ